MNNLIFNTTASQLHTMIANTTLTVDGSVEITNTALTVSGDVTISGTASVEVTNTSLTVGGSVEISNTTVTVSGDVTISGSASVEVTNASLTVDGSMTIAGHVIAETNTSEVNVTGTGVVFDDTDISEITTGSFFVYNTGSSTVTISLQISPTTDEGLYTLDLDNDDLPVANGESLLIAISKYGHYARLLYDAGAAATFDAYYIGQA